MRVFLVAWLGKILNDIKKMSLRSAIGEQKFFNIIDELRKIVPDISKQESGENEFNDFWELKRRGMHAFQCGLMLKALNMIDKPKNVVADIGDSAGTHMLYLKHLSPEKEIQTYSVNLDSRAIQKIRDRGLKAILKRAEEIEPDDIGGREGVDLFSSFEMVEHLHNPSIFFKRMASKMSCKRMVVTVPYVKQSRVGLQHIRNRSEKLVYAEDVHVFELSPEDWTLLLLHSGWKVTFGEIYYQYPRKSLLVTNLLRSIWKKTDYEGFWGAILEKDLRFTDLYQDWED